jgi:hypothetical protein
VSKKDFYLAKSAEARLAASGIEDWSARQALICVSDSWRFLADLEAKEQRPTRWPLGGSVRESEPE